MTVESAPIAGECRTTPGDKPAPRAWHVVQFARSEIAGRADIRLWTALSKRYYLLLSGGEERVKEIAVVNGVRRADGSAHIFFSPAASVAFADMLREFAAKACERPTRADLGSGALGTPETIRRLRGH
jgi:hypothetical protein